MEYRGIAKVTVEDTCKKGNWVYGNLIENNGSPYIVGNVVDVDGDQILFEYWVPVVKVSVGQSTGIEDRNDQFIFEGDILQLHCGSDDGVFNSHKVKGEVTYGETGFYVAIPDKIVKASGGSMKGKEVSWREMHSWVGGHTCLTQWQSKLEVVGNIYKNKKLLAV